MPRIPPEELERLKREVSLERLAAQAGIALKRHGQPTAKFLWKPNAYTLPNGNSVYILQERRDCFVYFEVNREQIIVGYRLEGTTCD